MLAPLRLAGKQRAEPPAEGQSTVPPVALRVTLAGQVALETEHGRIDAGGLGRLGRLAFAYLTWERHRPVPRDELAEVLWPGEPPPSWETSLRVVVSKLRGWLAGAGLDPSGTIASTLGCYRLHLPDGAVVDVEQATAGVEAARRALAAGEPAAARSAAEVAAALATAPFLPGTAGPWVEDRRAERAQLALRALELVSDAALAAADPEAALAAAEEAVRLDPLRESAWVRAMAAHAAAGNRGAALRAYERCRRHLAEELGVFPSPATEAAYLSLLGDAAAAPTAPAAVGQGPAPAVSVVSGAWPALPVSVSSFVGRREELVELAGALREHRLITLVGSGGVGKTRLALQVAADVAVELADGVAFVPLGELSHPADVAGSVATALGLDEDAGQPALEKVRRALASRHVLLLLDNCEHVVAAAGRLADDLLASCPRLSILATSREPLGVRGEVAWLVPSLDRTDAVRLFVERARAAHRGFGADHEEVRRAIETVVERLDGIPLAIELAAARTPVLSVAEIAARLEDRFALLTGGPRTAPARHQTLRAAVDWTYEALAEVERRFLQRLAVFAGTFTLGAAERVAGTEAAAEGVAGSEAAARTEALDLLHSLARRSLVVVEPDREPVGVPRFRLLETIRAYAAERLEESGDAGRVRARLLDWAVELAEEAEEHLDGPDQAVWLDRLEAEQPNVRGALHAALLAAEYRGAGDETDPPGDTALRLATALARFWEVRGHYEEGRRVLRRLLAENGPQGSTDLRARAQYAAGVLAQRQGDYAAARSRYEEALAVRRRLGDRYGAAVVLHGLAGLAALERDHVGARALYEQSAATGRELGELPLLAASVSNLGWVAHTGGDFATARRWYAEALALWSELGDDHSVALVLGHLGDLAYQEGDYGTAAAHHARSLELRSALGDRSGRADSLATLGHLAIRSGDLDTAMSHLEESLALRREVGDRASLPGALCNLADLALVRGEPDHARRHLEEAEAVTTAGRDRAGLAHVLLHQGRLHRAEGSVAQAAKRYAQAGEAAGLGPNPLTAEWLEGVAATAAAQGDAAAAARLLGAAAALRTAIGAPVPPHEADLFAQDVAAVRRALGPGADEALASGKALALEVALAEAAAVLAGA